MAIVGPLLWVAGLVVVAYDVRQGRAVGIALLILAGASLVSVAILLPLRARRVREERQP